MKIPEKNPGLHLEKNLLGTQKSQGLKENEANKEQGRVQSAASDRVDISEKARDIQQLKALASSGTDIRSERVAALREQIEAGTYNADGKRIADKLVRSALLDKA